MKVLFAENVRIGKKQLLTEKDQKSADESVRSTDLVKGFAVEKRTGRFLHFRSRLVESQWKILDIHEITLIVTSRDCRFTDLGFHFFGQPVSAGDQHRFDLNVFILEREISSIGTSVGRVLPSFSARDLLLLARL